MEMRRLVTGKQMKEIDGYAIRKVGIPSLVLMEQAALAVADEMEKRYGFIYVDKDNQGNGTLQRRKKDSFEYYKKVIASNGQDLELPAED